MTKQEITLKGIGGQLDEMVLTASIETIDCNLEDCVRLLFPQEGETMPRLRFKGFEGDWEMKQLSDCLEISEEKNTDNAFGIDDVLSVSDEYGVVNQIEHLGRSYAGKSVSGYKVLRPGQIVYTKSPLRAKPFGIIKENTGKAGIVSVLYAVYIPKEGIAPEYIHYYFDPAWRMNAYMRPLVNKGAKNTMNISDETALTGYIMIPKDIEEQKQIASFLKRLDTQMKLHQEQFEQLRKLKSACLDSMFPRTSENTPPIRFKGFVKEWNRTMASELFITFNNKNHPELPVLSACQDIRGMAIRSESGYDISHDKANEVTYKVVRPGQFVIHLRSFQGGFAHSSVEGITSPAYTVFGFKENEMHDDYFWKTVFMSRDFIERLKTITYGIRDGRSISFSEFEEMPLGFPEYDEQNLIGAFFKKIDSVISIEQQRLERLKQMKSSCLRSLFPSNGGGILPLIRFKGFEGEWLIVKFSDMVQRISSYDNSSKLPSVEFEDIVAGEGVLNKDIYRKNVLKRGIRFEEHDVLFGKLRPYLKNILYANFKGIAVGDFWVLRSLENIDPYFLYILVSSEAFMDVANISSGSKMPRADWNLVSKSTFAVPSSIAEQRRIASFFRSLDKKISLQSQQIEKLKQMKSACLYKMIA